MFSLESEILRSIAHDAITKFIKLGIRCEVCPDAHIQLMNAANMVKGEVAIGISHSGRTKDTIDALRVAKNRGATTICITNYNASIIAQVSHIKLLTACYETGFYSETMVSRISQLAIIDMLYMGIMLNDYDETTKRISNTNKVLSERAYYRLFLKLVIAAV